MTHRPRLLAAAAIAALTVAACSPGTPSTDHQAPASTGQAAAPPEVAITPAAARMVFARYAAAVTHANLIRQPQLLTAAEGGSSYQIHAGTYRWTKVSDPRNRAYWALSTTRPAFYIPRHGASWWVATAAWMEPRKPGTRPQTAYLVFARAGGRWLQVLAPDFVHGVDPPPRVATDQQGYASAVAAGDAAGLAVPPGRLPALTIRYLDARTAGPRCPRPGICVRGRPPGNGTFVIPDAGSLNDVSDYHFWRKRLLPPGTVADLHAVTNGPVYALRTAGGALVFYSLQAQLLLGAPPGFTMRVKIPGFYTAAHPRTTASLNYLEQFAVYDPAGPGPARVVADIAGPVSRG
jgi:hypothetical protein